MRQVRREIKSVHNVIDLLEEHADDKDKDEQPVADLLSFGVRGVFDIERQKEKCDHTAVNVGRIHISGHDGRPCPRKMRCDELKNTQINGKRRERRSLTGRVLDGNHRRQQQEGRHQRRQHRWNNEQKDSLPPLLSCVLLLQHELQKIKRDKRADQNRQIEVQDHDRGEDQRIQNRLLLPDKPLRAERQNGKECDDIQPHEVPVVTRRESAERVHDAADKGKYVLPRIMLIQVEGEGGAAQTYFQKDEEGDELADLLRFDQKDQIVQGRCRVIGRLHEEVASKAGVPAIDEALAVQDAVPDLQQEWRILMKTVDRDDRVVSERRNPPDREDQKSDQKCGQKGREHELPGLEVTIHN